MSNRRFRMPVARLMASALCILSFASLMVLPIAWAADATGNRA
jgi:hypothetical protein